MKKWEILSELKVKSAKLKIEDIIEALLHNRGLSTTEEKESFLFTSREDITMHKAGIDEKQVEKAVERIKRALLNNEKVIVFGDYDVDGITASAILWETLHSLGIDVLPYIPHRIEEGYGISLKGISNLIKQSPNVSLIITVDNGIVANDAIDFANSKGIDVIVTDHHTTGTTLPNAYAIVHTTKLCGAGIAYLVARYLKSQMSNQKNEEDSLLELAALGTIADLVPLKGCNRAIVKFGLDSLSRTKRPGLQELFAEAGCNNKTIGVYEVGHIIAPRLNATGRMSTAMDSLRLLCTKDWKRANELAALLGITNKERQVVMTDAAKHAIDNLKSQNSNLKKLLVAVHETYQEGVIGLVAGRIVEEYYRPAIVISKGEEYSKGSVRSINGFNIIDFLRQSSDFFVNVGGHPMAAGFTIETSKIIHMQEALERLAEALDDGLFIRTLRVDCEIPLFFINVRFYNALKNLEPFGMGNPEPVFLTKNVRIENMKVLGKDGKHLKLTVSHESAEFHAIAFGFGDKVNTFHIGDQVDMVYTIIENTWNGRSSLELKVKDIKQHAV